MTIQTFSVSGMTCDHCVIAVREEIGALSGVTDVAVELDAGGSSAVHVTSATPLSDEQVAAALDEAGGYRLTGRSRPPRFVP
jgi:copper chaperone CopZ